MNYDELMKLFGTNLRFVRHESLGLTVRTLSGLSGISPSVISLLERGKTGCTMKTAQALCAACGVPVSDMMSR